MAGRIASLPGQE
jgi:hypothetical protein